MSLSKLIMDVNTNLEPNRYYTLTAQLDNNTELTNNPIYISVEQLDGEGNYTEIASSTLLSEGTVTLRPYTKSSNAMRVVFKQHSASNFSVDEVLFTREDVMTSTITSTICSNDADFEEDYRFGFNGMEKDNEIKGTGNSLDFGARIYDSRLGRWLSLDPLMKEYPAQSAFNFAANNPIFFVDLDGRKVRIHPNSSSSVDKLSGFLELLKAEDITFYNFVTTARLSKDKRSILVLGDEGYDEAGETNDIIFEVEFLTKDGGLDGSDERVEKEECKIRNDKNTVMSSDSRNPDGIDGDANGVVLVSSMTYDKETKKLVLTQRRYEGDNLIQTPVVVDLSNCNDNNIWRYSNGNPTDNTYILNKYLNTSTGKKEYLFTIRLDDYFSDSRSCENNIYVIWKHELGHIEGKLLFPLNSTFFYYHGSERGHEDGEKSGKHAEDRQNNIKPDNK